MTTPSEPGSSPVRSGRPSRWLLPLAVAGLLGAATLVARSIIQTRPSVTPPTAEGEALHGFVLDPAAPAPPVAATAAGGRSWRLADQEGKVVALFFGYASCPDVCPQTLALLAQAKAELGPAGDRFAVAMITVDPERDTPDALQRYMTGFDPSFTGLDTGAGLRSVADAYGASYTRDLPPAEATRAAQIAGHDEADGAHADGDAHDEGDGHDEGADHAAGVPGGFTPGSPAYTVAHSGVVFLIDPTGRLRSSYLAPFDPRDLAADVTLLLNGSVESARAGRDGAADA